MRRQLIAAVMMVAVFTVITGLVYPLVVTGVAQVLFKDKGDGSFVEVDGKRVGSRLIGQVFTKPEYFHPRPSAAGDGYDGSASSGTNKGPTNEEWLAEVEQRITDYRRSNGLRVSEPVPVDAVTASASGLDPHISVANARIQARRVAAARQMPIQDVVSFIHRHTQGRALGFLGEPAVHVLELNLALDAAT